MDMNARNGTSPEKPLLSADMTVAEILQSWPDTIPVFLQNRLGCVGCAMAPFDTVSDVVKIYDLSLDGFLGDLREAIRSEGTNTG
jgi:hybrid cluster-associated redox disulfide protein